MVIKSETKPAVGRRSGISLPTISSFAHTHTIGNELHDKRVTKLVLFLVGTGRYDIFIRQRFIE